MDYKIKELEKQNTKNFKLIKRARKEFNQQKKSKNKDSNTSIFNLKIVTLIALVYQ